jgi:REP element-mobilizing transposase RayT
MTDRGRENEGPLPDPLAYFLTWSTYGTWLPGDERGWIEYRRGWQIPNAARELEAEAQMTEDACVLSPEQRQIVEATIAEHCRIRNWVLHAVNCRSNHLHVVVTAPGYHPDVVREQFKAWCTRRLKEHAQTTNTNPTGKRKIAVRQQWWAERGSKRYINDPDSLEAAILYVRDGQD